MRVYGKVGTPHMLIGGELSEGWALMSGLPPEGEGWLAGADGEWYLPPKPEPTMADELRAEQEATASLVQQNNQRWVAAASTPSADRETKVAAIEAEGVQIRETHKANVAAIKDKWVAKLTKPATRSKSTT